MWFDLKGDERLGRCATQGCGQQPIYRFEIGGTGSNFCSGCRAFIEREARRCRSAALADEQGGQADAKD